MQQANAIKAAIFLLCVLVSKVALGLQQGFPVPNFVLPALVNVPADAQGLKLSDYRGKVVYIDFWASWCIPCRVSLPALRELHTKYSARGFEVIAINMDEDDVDALRFLKTFPVNYPIVRDPTGLVAESYELKSMPHAFIIDKTGKLRHVHEGFKKRDKTKIDQYISQILQK